MTRYLRRSLVAFAAASAAVALSACFSMSDLGPYDQGSEIPRTPGAIARALKLDGVAWAPIPIAKYSGAPIAQLIVADDAAYCISENDTVSVVGIGDGAPRWSLKLDRSPASKDGFVWGLNSVGFLSQNHLTVVSKRAGARLANCDLGFAPSSAGLLTDDSFFSGAWGSGYAFRSAALSDGWPGWANVVDDAITAKPLMLGTTGADRAIVFASHDGRVVSVEPRPSSGAPPEPNWVVKTTGGNVNDLATDGQSVYVACNDGVLYGISRGAGVARWKWYNDGGAPLAHGPEAANGLVYQPTAGSVVAIDAASGHEKYRVQGASHYLTHIGDRDFYSMTDRSIGAVETETGRVTSTVTSPLFVMVPTYRAGGALVFSDGKTLFALR